MKFYTLCKRVFPTAVVEFSKLWHILSSDVFMNKISLGLSSDDSNEPLGSEGSPNRYLNINRPSRLQGTARQ
jgi:hypothetical protein